MRKEDRYKKKEKGLPYYYDYVIERTPVGLKEYEIFDGNDVKWGVREDYISTNDDKLYMSTPLFENMVTKDGKDKERIIYLPEFRYIVNGKINGSEVLCKVNKSAISENDFCEIKEFGEEATIEIDDNKIAFVKYKKDGWDKCVYFDCDKFKPISSEFDVIYREKFFIKSYILRVGTSICWEYIARVFIGEIDEKTKKTKLYGWDKSKHKMIKFPLTDDGFIDDEKMMVYVEKTKDTHCSMDSLESQISFVKQGIGYTFESDLVKKNKKKK